MAIKIAECNFATLAATSEIDPTTLLSVISQISAIAYFVKVSDFQIRFHAA